MISRNIPGPACLLPLVALLLLSACSTPFDRTGPKFNARQTNVVTVTNLETVALGTNLPPALLQPQTEPFTLGPGDQLEIELTADPATRTTVTVGPDGKIYFYLLPGLDVWGLSLAQTRALLRQELAKYVAVPDVTLSLRAVESRRVWLLGRLHNAGVYPMVAPMTLLEAISAAGGLVSPTGPTLAGTEDLADLHRSFIIRQGQVLPVDFYRLVKEGDMTQNVQLRPDDFVYVPTAVARQVYVLGAVRTAQPVAWTEHTTLISAIASAGGTVRYAYLSHVAVVRGSLNQPRIAIVNYKDVVEGRAPDFHLQPRDIVYIPVEPYKTLVRYVNLILDTFAQTVAINEGARAVSQNVVPVGVQIGIGAR